MGRVLLGVTLGFEGRTVESVFFKAGFRALAVLERLVAGFLSMFVADVSTERRPRDAFVGEMDLGGPEAEAGLADPFIAVLVLSCISS